MTERAIKVQAGKTQVLIIRETVRESVISDGVTFLMLVTLCSYGVFINSFVIELIGGLMFMGYLVSRALSYFTKSKHFTTEQAIETLRKWKEETQ